MERDEDTSAQLSECGRYRFELRRIWGAGAYLVLFVGLNPSTADATADDPTVRRWRGFAKAWGHDGFIVCNAYPLRSTDPRNIGGDSDDDDAWCRNMDAIQHAADEAHRIVCCWGARITPARQRHVLSALRPRDVYHLGLTKDGFPRHPLYLRADTKPELWT